MRLALVVLLLAGAALSRPYHPTAIADFAKVHHTHVCATGTVTLVKREADGDLHVRLSQGKAFIVAEQIPSLVPKGTAPKLGEKATACGIRRFDDERGHGWFELHPVEEWRR